MSLIFAAVSYKPGIDTISPSMTSKGVPQSLFEDTKFKKENRKVASDQKESTLPEAEDLQDEEGDGSYSLDDPNLYEADGSGVSNLEELKKTDKSFK